MAYDNTNGGFLGKNNKKETDKHPDVTGYINVEGKDYWLSGWKNAKGYGLKVKPKDQTSANAAASKAKQSVDDLNDDIPF